MQCRRADGLQAMIQTCIVHLICNSLNYVAWKDRKALAAQLKPVYEAVNAQAAEAALTAFEQGHYGMKCPPILAGSSVIPASRTAC